MPCHFPGSNVKSLLQYKHRHNRSPNHSRCAHTHTDMLYIMLMTYCTSFIRTHPRPHPGLLHMHKHIGQHPMHPQGDTAFRTDTHVTFLPTPYGGTAHLCHAPAALHTHTHYLSRATQRDSTPLPHLTRSAHSRTPTMAAPALHGEDTHPPHLITGTQAVPALPVLSSAPPATDRQTDTLSTATAADDTARPAPHPHRHCSRTPVPCLPRPPSADVPPGRAATFPPSLPSG